MTLHNLHLTTRLRWIRLHCLWHWLTLVFLIIALFWAGQRMLWQPITQQNTAPTKALAGAKKKLTELKKELAEEGPRINNQQLLTAQQSATLIKHLLAHNAHITVLSIHTFPPYSAEQAAPSLKPLPTTQPSRRSKKPVAKKAKSGPLLAHSLQLRFRATYQNMLAVIAQLQSAPFVVLWQSMDYQVTDHPQAIITLQLATLSPASGAP